MAIAQPSHDPLHHWSAQEIRKMPQDQRDAVLSAAAAAEVDYHIDIELTDFNAFGEDDLHGNSSSSELR